MFRPEKTGRDGDAKYIYNFAQNEFDDNKIAVNASGITPEFSIAAIAEAMVCRLLLNPYTEHDS